MEADWWFCHKSLFITNWRCVRRYARGWQLTALEMVFFFKDMLHPLFVRSIKLVFEFVLRIFLRPLNADFPDPNSGITTSANYFTS